MKKLYNLLYLTAAMLVATMTLASCNDDNTSNLQLDGGTMIHSLSLSGYEAEIDNTAKTVFVGVPVDCDLATLVLDELTLDPGAACDVKIGDCLNCNVPQNLRITNGDVYTNYTLTVKHDNVEVLSASLNNKYAGTVDNTARTIQFFVPLDENVAAMSLYYTLNAGAKGNPEPGSVMDFSEPVVITATYRTATIEYTVNVIKDDMSQEPKAFIGNADDIAGLGAEAKAAAEWMMANVPNSRYVSLRSILSGDVKLVDFKMVWCHFDWLDWPGVMWDSRDLFNDYYIKGGNILASRDGARYINDVWRITKDQQSPNNMFGGEVYETLEDDLGFTIVGHEDHPIFVNLPAEDGRILLASKGCSNSNRTLQWVVDWDAYGSMAVWEEKTGATALAAGHDFDANRVTIAEFVPRDILAGYTSGRVITIGTPGYEWNITNGATNLYRGNIEILTKNSINYLCK
ncbi:MAG: DUF4960 domain-containing protein [Muribaculaceae bacterium]|nr:DUF4960 domain-containing protein [Muribaculaceae bacterium]